MSAPMGRGRGRGRGTTLPAWMTRGDGAGPTGAGGVGADAERRDRGAPAGERGGFDFDRERERGRDDRGRGYDDRNNGDRGDRDARGYDRGGRAREGARDYGDDRGRGPDRPPSQRGHRGLGYDDRSSRGDRDLPWERDRGMGRGRGRSDDMNFVRGEVYDRNRGRDDRGMGRGRGDNRDYDGGMGSDVRGAEPNGMGRGRGRGRGFDINKPAWMTSGPGPTGDAPANSASSPQKDETMEKLLAQARQVQQERTRRDEEQRAERTQRTQKSGDTSRREDRRDSKAKEEEELQRKRQKEQEDAARKAEEERQRLERLREEEEQRQLLALVGDLPDEDRTDDGKSSKKRKEDTDENGDMFEFETEEEREERLARKRREERRKKLRKMEEESNVGSKEEMKVDQPRNVAGVVASETNANEKDSKEAPNADSSKMDVEPSKVPEAKPTEIDSGEDSFDIFAADNATPVPTASSSKNAMTTANSKRNAVHNAQECDDAEGYYKARIGEIITLPKERGEDLRGSGNGEDDSENMARFRVLGIIGKGVFSSVIKCVEESGNDASGAPLGRVIAMKVIRNNEIMARAAAKEMRILRMLCQQRPRHKRSKKDASEDNGENGDEEKDPEERERRERENHNIVRLLDVDPSTATTSKDGQQSYAAPPPEFRSHCIFLFEFLPFNLREVLSRFGKNVGINLTAVRSYARQLLCALAHLERHRVVHADLKPDNILVSANFSTVKLADFGSAFFETDHDNDSTPYLVSRFYRSPEIILGLEYDRMVDLWSLSVTLAELFTGSVLFPGKTNNDMLVRFMDAMGPLSHKMVKRHSLSYTRMGLQPHFEVGITGGTFQLRKHDIDRVTGQPVCRLVNVLSAKPDARLAQVLLRASKGGDASERVAVMQFADFLNRCLALDPARRLSVREALRHDFFAKKRKKKEKEDAQE